MHTIKLEILRPAMAKLLAERGVQARHAEMLIDALLATSLDGIDTHGIRLFATYLQEILDGACNCQPEMQLQSSFPALGLLDADHALGAVAGTLAMRYAIERAKTYGIGIIVVKNSNHFGAAGVYAQQAAKADMLGLVMSNSDALVVPFNGKQPLNGTNPIAMAAPGLDGELFSLDMATSQVAFSRIRHYLANALQIQPGWASDEEGLDAAISQQVQALLPLGGYKGQGLGMMVQIMTGLLANMPIDRDLTHLHDAFDGRRREISQTFIAINIQGFCPLPEFQQRLSDLLKIFRESPAVAGEAVLVPGDKERQSRAQRLAHGIPLSEAEYQLLSPYF